MPAVSPAQRKLFAIAEHNPSILHKENKSLANLPHKTLHDFAATKGLHDEPDADDAAGYSGPGDNDADDKVKKTFAGIGRGKMKGK